MWDKKIKQDPSFGTFSNHTEMDEEVDKKFCEAHDNKVIDLFQNIGSKDNYTGLVCMIVWGFGRYLYTRGEIEIVKVNWEEVYFDSYKTGPEKGIYFVEFIPDEYKANRCNLTKSSH